MAKSPKLIQLHKLPRVAYRVKVAHKLLARNNHRSSAVVGVEAEACCLLEILVQEEVYMVLLVVDKSEWRNRARLQAEITRHTLCRGETQLALMQAVFKVVNSHILVAIEADQIVAIALVVTEKEVFAVHRAIVTPILLGNLDCRRCRVRISLIFYVVRIEVVKDLATALIELLHRLSLILRISILKDKRKGIGNLLDALRGWLACTVACVGIDTDKHRVIALVAVLQLGCELE